MASAPSSCTTNSGPDVQPPDHNGVGPQLPAELIQQILRDVRQPDLLAFAQASHACHAYALEAGLRIHRHVYWSNLRNAGFGGSLQKLDMVLDHAAEHGRYLNIAITARMVPCGRGTRTAEAYHEAMQLLVPSMCRSLPNLVQLDVPFADFAALCAEAAPKLQAFTVYHTGTEGPVLIPSNIFAGIAPKLRKVALDLTDTSPMTAWQPVAAFRGVTHLKLTADSIPQHLPLALVFSALRVLIIEAPQASGMQAIDLCGLALRYFAWSGNTRLLTAASAAALKDVAVVEHRAPQFAGEPGWPVPCGDLCAVAVRHRKAPIVSVGPRDGAWRRTILPTQLRSGALPLADLPMLATNLFSLTIEESLVTAFVQAPAVLAELCKLFLDISKPNERPFPLDRLSKAVPSVRCPRLARVVLLGAPGARPVVVTMDSVVRLGHTLGLRKARPSLIVSGCAWHPFSTSAAGTQLSQLFSGVHDAGTTPVGVPEYYDIYRCSGYSTSE